MTIKRQRPIVLCALLVLALAAVADAQQLPEGSGTPIGPAPPLPDLDATPEEVGVKTPPPTESVFSQRAPRYLLRPGDVLELTFEFSPEFNQPELSVQPDGFVTLKGVGDVQVSGLTVPDLRKLLESSYSQILKEPRIAVVLKQFEEPYFIVSGIVRTPGKYPLRGATTLTQAIAIAGGFNENSKHSQVVLFRRANNDWLETKVVNVKEMLNSQDLREDITLHSGDMIWVPQNLLGMWRRFLPRPTFGMP